MKTEAEETEEALAQVIETYLTKEYQIKGTFSPNKAGKDLATIILGALRNILKGD